MASACQNFCFAFLNSKKSYTTKTLIHYFLLAQNLSFVFLPIMYFFHIVRPCVKHNIVIFQLFFSEERGLTMIWLTSAQDEPLDKLLLTFSVQPLDSSAPPSPFINVLGHLFNHLSKKKLHQ